MNETLLRETVRAILSEIIIDDEIEAQSNWRAMSAEERSKIMTSGVSQEQASEIAHYVLDLVGLVPGPGDVADVINAALYVKEEKYFLAALSIMCLIPAVGSVFGAIKLTTKRIPAEAVRAIVSHQDEIRKVTRRVAVELPNSQKIQEAVEIILSRVKYGDEIDLDELAIGTARPSISPTTLAKTDFWYKNPVWKEKIIQITRPLLTKVLNRISTKSYKARLIKNLSRRFTQSLRSASLERTPIEAKEFVEFAIKRNDDLINKVLEKLPVVIEEIVQNCEIRIIDDAAVADALTSGKKTLAVATASKTSEKNYINIFLPRFGSDIISEEAIVSQLENTIIHEFRHVVDFRLYKYFGASREKMIFSNAADMRDLFQVMTDNMNIPENMIQYITDPAEMWVRVDSARDFFRKEFITAEDLQYLSKVDFDEIPNDLRVFSVALEELPLSNLEKVADAMNKVL